MNAAISGRLLHQQHHNHILKEGAYGGTRGSHVKRAKGAALRGARSYAWNQAGLVRGRERASSDRAIGRAGGLGECTQARLSEVAILTGCSIFFAQISRLLLKNLPWTTGRS
jgi:hypothetical protein